MFSAELHPKKGPPYFEARSYDPIEIPKKEILRDRNMPEEGRALEGGKAPDEPQVAVIRTRNAETLGCGSKLSRRGKPQEFWYLCLHLPIGLARHFGEKFPVFCIRRGHFGKKPRKKRRQSDLHGRRPAAEPNRRQPTGLRATVQRGVKAGELFPAHAPRAAQQVAGTGELCSGLSGNGPTPNSMP